MGLCPPAAVVREKTLSLADVDVVEGEPAEAMDTT